MIEWIQHWDEMRFYYWTGLNWLVLLPVYLGQLLALGVLWWLLGKVWKQAWIVVLLLLPVAAIWPWWEELNIAWHFGQLCRKDAGIFVYKTVEVEGFFDSTRPTHDGPRSPEAAKELDRGGYRFYEMVFPIRTGGPDKVVHLEKVRGVWIATVLDHATARYHYRWPHMNTPLRDKIGKTERVVSDIETGEVLGRYLDYDRTAPWFFFGLDRPLMFCKEAEKDAREKGTVFGPRMVLLPLQQDH